MRRATASVVGALALAIGVVLGIIVTGGLGIVVGYALFADDDVSSAVSSAVPFAVEDTRAALLGAARSGDYEELRLLVPESGLEYTYGGPVEGGPIAYWQELERTTDERPLEALAAILQMPYVLSRGSYVWPWAYTAESRADLSEHERNLLAPLGSPDELVLDGTGYLGWRAGIEPDGTWAFFVAGD